MQSNQIFQGGRVSHDGGGGVSVYREGPGGTIVEGRAEVTSFGGQGFISAGDFTGTCFMSEATLLISSQLELVQDPIRPSLTSKGQPAALAVSPNHFNIYIFIQIKHLLLLIKKTFYKAENRLSYDNRDMAGNEFQIVMGKKEQT